MTVTNRTLARGKPIAARCFAAFALVLAAPLGAGAQVLTADEVVRLALGNASNATLAEAPVEAAEGRLVSTQTWRNPVLSVEREGVEGLGGDGSETLVTLEREFDISGRRALQVRGARADLHAARGRRAIQRAETRTDALAAFYALLAAQQEQAALEEFGAQLTALGEATRQRVQAGDASRLELERVRQETLLLPTLAAEARLEVESAADRLFIATGANVSGYERIAGQLLPAIDPQSAASPVSARLASLEAEADAAEARERAASRLVPDVTVGVGLRQIEGPMEEIGVLVSASVPLPIFDRHQGEQRERAADTRLAEARLRLEQRRFEAQTGMLARRMVALHRTALEYEEAALASARELRRIALVSYQGGETSALEAIDAIRTAYEAELRLISLKHRTRETELALEELIAETD
ncbi:TolC family protein [Marinicauda algicola]|uniref:TolC family protein n=1 Tax=Marinicauda algicola TaxID=2029849 RepID=A0A4S2GYN5_9PROT|nr:TolC family protein [Marinicauda algicola]TGY88214.1 TolC family protein [Marinicauda algicola]